MRGKNDRVADLDWSVCSPALVEIRRSRKIEEGRRALDLGSYTTCLLLGRRT